MSSLSRMPIVALGVLAGVLAMCMALPALDPNCSMAADAAGALGACAVVQAWSRTVALIAVATGAIVGAFLLASIGIHAVLHDRFASRLRRDAQSAVVADHPVRLVPGIGAALVAGLRHPRTYCSDDLARRLDADELRAVLLHERHHELVHAPARLVVLSAMAPFLGRLGPSPADWLEQQRAAIEIAADRYAIWKGATPATLARAILSLQVAVPSRTMASFAASGDLRLRALLGEERIANRARPGAIWPPIIVAVVVAAFCLALSLP